MRHLAIYTALSLAFVGALPAEAQTRTLRRNGEEFPVRAGDLIRNPPSGEHSLYNLGPEPLRIFVFEVSVNP